MNFYVFLKVFADLCLYFGFIGALPALFPHSFQVLWPSILCAAGAATAAFLSDHGKNSVRLLFLLPPVLCLLLGSTVTDWLILIPPAVYTIVLILRDEWELEYFHFREVFRKALICLGIALLVVHFGNIIEAGGHKKGVLDSTALLRSGLMYAVCGIILQRQLRLGSGNIRDKSLNNAQLALVSIGTGLFLIAIIAAERYLASQGISLSDLIGQALRFLVGAPVYLIGWLFTLLMGLDGKMLQKIEDSQAVETEPSPTAPLPEMGEAILQQPQVEVGFPWWLAVLILAALTAALILLTRVLRSRTADAVLTGTVSKILPKPKEPKPRRRSNRSRLRRVYREFLKAEKRKGHKLHSWHTSQDILDDLGPGSNAEAAASLRGLYLSARYDPNSTVTDEQVQKAKEALKRYKND